MIVLWKLAETSPEPWKTIWQFLAWLMGFFLAFWLNNIVAAYTSVVAVLSGTSLGGIVVPVVGVSAAAILAAFICLMVAV